MKQNPSLKRVGEAFTLLFKPETPSSVSRIGEGIRELFSPAPHRNYHPNRLLSDDPKPEQEGLPRIGYEFYKTFSPKESYLWN